MCKKRERGVCWSAKGKGIHGCWEKHDVIGVIHGSVNEFKIERLSKYGGERSTYKTQHTAYALMD